MTRSISAILALAVFINGCNTPGGNAALRAVGARVGVPARDENPAVDSDGDQNPSNDVDNGAEILTAAGAEVGGQAASGNYAGALITLIGLAATAAGGYFEYRRRKRKNG